MHVPIQQTIARSGDSPFDQIRHTDQHGEWWSARDLQAELGYIQWRNFETAVMAARQSIDVNNGVSAAHEHIADSSKLIHAGNGANRHVPDYRMTRYGAYRTMLECDGGKPQVAAAKHYFAVRAHQAEQAEASLQPRQLSRKELAKYWYEAEERAEVAEQRAAEGDRFKRAIEAGDGLTPRSFHKKYFSAVTEKTFSQHLYDRGYLINQRGKGPWDAKRRRRRDGRQHRHPTAKGKEYFYLHGSVGADGKRHESIHVLPGGIELALRDRLAAEGLVANEQPMLFALDAT